MDALQRGSMQNVLPYIAEGVDKIFRKGLKNRNLLDALDGDVNVVTEGVERDLDESKIIVCLPQGMGSCKQKHAFKAAMVIAELVKRNQLLMRKLLEKRKAYLKSKSFESQTSLSR